MRSRSASRGVAHTSKTRRSALRAAFRTSSICWTQLLASATALMRGQILPPSEMKSLYGSTTSSAVMSLSYVGVSTLFPPALTELPRFADRQFLGAIRSMRPRRMTVRPCSGPVSTSRFQNQIRNRLRLRYERNVTRFHLDRLGGHSLCHEALEIRIDGPILRRDGVPAWL